MTELDSMVNAACKGPDDATRGALADIIREQRGKAELADAVEADTGSVILRETLELSIRVSLPVSYELLWTAYAVMPRIKTEPPAIRHPVGDLPAIPWQPRRVVTIPEWVPGVVPDDGQWTVMYGTQTS